MGGELKHPDELFDYLNGALDGPAAKVVEEHLRECADCMLVTDVALALKARVSTANDAVEVSTTKESHPDSGLLASFFYSPLDRTDSSVASHVAQCAECAEAVALYAQAEVAASQITRGKETREGVPAEAWSLIREWEDSSLALPKAESEALGKEFLARVAVLFRNRADRLDEFSGASLRAGLVPVIIVNREGNLKGVELFEKVTDENGVEVLQHPGGAERFDEKQIHSLLVTGTEEHAIVTRTIRYGTVRLEGHAAANERPGRDRYFIVED